MRTAQDEDPDDVSGPNKEGSSRTSYRLGPWPLTSEVWSRTNTSQWLLVANLEMCRGHN